MHRRQTKRQHIFNRPLMVHNFTRQYERDRSCSLTGLLHSTHKNGYGLCQAPTSLKLPPIPRSRFRKGPSPLEFPITERGTGVPLQLYESAPDLASCQLIDQDTGLPLPDASPLLESAGTPTPRERWPLQTAKHWRLTPPPT